MIFEHDQDWDAVAEALFSGAELPSCALVVVQADCVRFLQERGQLDKTYVASKRIARVDHALKRHNKRQTAQARESCQDFMDNQEVRTIHFM